MTAEERKESFAEFDPGYEFPEDFEYELVPHKVGYNLLSAIIIYFIAKAAIDELGAEGEKAVIQGLENTRKHLVSFMKTRALQVAEPCDRNFLKDNMTLDLDWDAETVWARYPDERVKKLVKKYFYDQSDEFLT
jgi:hypothetical protein